MGKALLPLFSGDRFFIPAGKCPVILTASDEMTVRQWCRDVAAAIKECPGSSTLIYYAQEFYPNAVWIEADRVPYAEVCGHIRVAFGLSREEPPEPKVVKVQPPPPPPAKRAPPPPPPRTNVGRIGPPHRPLQNIPLRRPPPPPPKK